MIILKNVALCAAGTGEWKLMADGRGKNKKVSPKFCDRGQMHTLAHCASVYQCIISKIQLRTKGGEE